MDLVKLREELEIDEGVEYEIYNDHLGYPTFGIGHLILESDPENGEEIGTPVSEERVIEAFERDVEIVVEDCKILYSDFEFKNLLEGNKNRFKNWKCFVPSEHLFIRNNKLYAGVCKKEFLGDLLSDKDTIKKSFTICDGRPCNCTADLRSSKYAP